MCSKQNNSENYYDEFGIEILSANELITTEKFFGNEKLYFTCVEPGEYDGLSGYFANNWNKFNVKTWKNKIKFDCPKEEVVPWAKSAFNKDWGDDYSKQKGLE